jgi:hypothetical protein
MKKFFPAPALGSPKSKSIKVRVWIMDDPAVGE